MPASSERTPTTAVVLLMLSPGGIASAPLRLNLLQAIAVTKPQGGVIICHPADWIEPLSLTGWEQMSPVEGEHPIITGLRHTLAMPCDVVLIHDATWPLATPDLMRAVRDKALEAGAAIAVGSVKETIKQVREGQVVGTLPREGLALVQWPAALRRDVATRVVALGESVPHDATLPELLFAAGLPLAAVAGPPENSGIASAADLAVAEALLAKLK